MPLVSLLSFPAPLLACKPFINLHRMEIRPVCCSLPLICHARMQVVPWERGIISQLTGICCMCAQAAPTLDIPTVYDILIHMTPGMDDCAMHQSWCGADTSRAQKGVLSSQERRKRKHKEVRDLFTLSVTLRLIAALNSNKSNCSKLCCYALLAGNSSCCAQGRTHDPALVCRRASTVLIRLQQRPSSGPIQRCRSPPGPMHGWPCLQGRSQKLFCGR